MTGIVTDARGRILLVKGDRRGWEPPGGQVELGEDLVTALRREVREESGCEVEVGGLVCVHSNLGRPARGVPEQVVLTFSCRWVGGEPRGREKCSDAALFPAEEALRLVEAPQQREKLRDAIAGGSAPKGSPRVRYYAYRTEPYEASLTRWKD